MKTIAYTALLYGACYLDAAIRSVIDNVDEIWILHTEVGSHGHRTAAPSPDSRDTLHDIAHAAAGAKLRWVTSQWEHEGAQRDRIFSLCPDAELVVPVDSDEIFEPGLLDIMLKMAQDNPTVRRWRVPFRHYWRSLYRCVLHDPAYPHRLYNVHGDPSLEATVDAGGKAVNHFGYALPIRYQAYKWGQNGTGGVHGHLGELRRDVNWLEDVYIANRQFDTHPVGSIYWNPEVIDPFRLGYLPAWMADHPFAMVDVIE